MSAEDEAYIEKVFEEAERRWSAFTRSRIEPGRKKPWQTVPVTMGMTLQNTL